MVELKTYVDQKTNSLEFKFSILYKLFNLLKLKKIGRDVKFDWQNRKVYSTHSQWIRWTATAQSTLHPFVHRKFKNLVASGNNHYKILLCARTRANYHRLPDERACRYITNTNSQKRVAETSTASLKRSSPMIVIIIISIISVYYCYIVIVAIATIFPLPAITAKRESITPISLDAAAGLAAVKADVKRT